MKKITLSILLIISLFFLTLNTYAQEGPGNFFAKNYSISGLEKEVHSFPRYSLSNKYMSSDNNRKRVKKIKNSRPYTGNSSGTAEILSIGAILNCLDRKHLEKEISKVLLLRKQKKIDIGQFYLLGCRQWPEPDPVIMKLIGRGAKPLPVKTVPEKYAVQTSPAWIIDTPEGEHLLEGVPLLNQISPGGRFYIPDSRF